MDDILDQICARTEQAWVEAKEPLKLKNYLKGLDQNSNSEGRTRQSDRKWRLLGCASVRRIWHLITEEVCRKSVEIAEEYADGRAIRAHMVETRRMAEDLLLPELERLQPFPPGTSLPVPLTANYLASCAADKSNGKDLLFLMRWLSGMVTDLLTVRTKDTTQEQIELSAVDECDIIREIFGNPFRPVNLDAAWLTSSVTAIAQSIYSERCFQDMPILADALEEAGCTNDDILRHCRGGGSHVRGCWVIDLILGKE